MCTYGVSQREGCAHSECELRRGGPGWPGSDIYERSAMGEVRVLVSEMDGQERSYKLQPTTGCKAPKGEVVMSCSSVASAAGGMRQPDPTHGDDFSSSSLRSEERVTTDTQAQTDTAAVLAPSDFR
jgi:hypothetical protein